LYGACLIEQENLSQQLALLLGPNLLIGEVENHKVCGKFVSVREKYGYHSLGCVVPPLMTPHNINCSSSSVESAEANVLLAKHSIARRRRKSVAAMSTWSNVGQNKG